MQIVVLGLIFDVNGTLVNIAVAVGTGSLRSRLLGGGARRARLLERATGVLFIGLGTRLAFRK